MTENKPAKKKDPAKVAEVPLESVGIPLEDITKVIFVDEKGEEFSLVPLRFGKFMLTRFGR